MKKSIFTLVIAFILTGTIFYSCTTDNKKVENAQQNLQEAKQDLNQAKQDEVNDFQKFKNESIEQINKNDVRIGELRNEMKTEKREYREKYEKKIDELERKNHELRTKLEAFHDDGKSDWKEFKTEFKHDLDGLGNAFKDITIRNTK